MSWNCTAYFLDARALLLTERVIVLCVYAAHACSFNYKSDYSKSYLSHFAAYFKTNLRMRINVLLFLEHVLFVRPGIITGMTIISHPTWNDGLTNVYIRP